MTSDELISSCKSVRAFSTADALPPSQSKLHPAEKNRRKRDLTYSNPQKTSALPNPWLAPKAPKLLLVPERFSHYWTCLMLFITCTYSKRSGLFLIMLLNCRIYYTSLHNEFHRFNITHLNLLHVELLYTYKKH